MRSAQAGDRRAFAALVERYWSRLFGWLFRLTNDRHTAEDVTQESFLKALTGLASFKAGTHFRAWLFRIAHNNWVNHRRRGFRTPPIPSDVPALAEGPAELAMNREAIAHLAGAVGRLPRGYRAAFLLRVEEGLSFRDIACILSITKDTARWRVCRARKKLMEGMATHLSVD